ncbi:hypothetical protein SLS62_004425 [Diatrype stigma]|uniref:Uncharacterized protein n=1 Tax=Diatrype stigma TaxID=117547 RepID=A0AAN9UUL9_9PEZI
MVAVRSNRSCLGIGLMMTKALAGAGAKKVYILGRRKEVLDKAAAAHPSIVPIECDVCVKRSLQAAVDFVAKDAGHVNLVIANSGVIGPETRYSADMSVAELRGMLFDGVSVEDFTETLNVNVTGAYFTLLAFLELLDAGNQQALKGGAGAFGAPGREGSDVPSVQSQAIFTSSISAYSRFWTSTPAYGSSKAAVAHLAKHASTNLAKYGIRVNALAPGCESGGVSRISRSTSCLFLSLFRSRELTNPSVPIRHSHGAHQDPRSLQGDEQRRPVHPREAIWRRAGYGRCDTLSGKQSRGVLQWPSFGVRRRKALNHAIRVLIDKANKWWRCEHVLLLSRRYISNSRSYQSLGNLHRFQKREIEYLSNW